VCEIFFGKLDVNDIKRSLDVRNKQTSGTQECKRTRYSGKLDNSIEVFFVGYVHMYPGPALRIKDPVQHQVPDSLLELGC
jgi:hypothetical protein